MGHLAELELRRITLPLVAPFRSSAGEQRTRDALVVRVAFDGPAGRVDGWGECVAMAAPTYSPEFVDAAELVVERHLWPALVGFERRHGEVRADAVAGALAGTVGHPMAKAALEMAVLDAELRTDGVGLAARFGVERQRVPSGVSVGLSDSLDGLLAEVAGYVADGYTRIKLKIAPGWDVEPVRLVRRLVGPEVLLQVDANTAYTRADTDHLRRLDEHDLLLIEQPLAADDLIGHARLAAALDTPVCLDESIDSIGTAETAIELGAAEIVNIKPGRVGGYLTARRLHDLCLERGVPVWCGGMLETGIGRAANIALAALPGFTLPGDISAAGRFYVHDIVTEPVVVVDGHVGVPTGSGLGADIDLDALGRVTTATRVLAAG